MSSTKSVREMTWIEQTSVARTCSARRHARATDVNPPISVAHRAHTPDARGPGRLREAPVTHGGRREREALVVARAEPEGRDLAEIRAVAHLGHVRVVGPRLDAHVDRPVLDEGHVVEHLALAREVVARHRNLRLRGARYAPGEGRCSSLGGGLGSG